MKGWLEAAGFVAWRLLAAAAVGVLVGLLAGHTWAGVVLALGGYLAFELYRLNRFEYWLRYRGLLDPPDYGGAWGELVALVMRIYRRKKFHKQRLVEVLRELRDSTASMPDAVVTLNAENEISWMNRTAETLLGLRQGEDRGLRIENLLRQPEFKRYLDGGDYAAPLVLRMRDEADRWLAIQVLPYGVGQKLLIARDVSHQTRLETMRKDFVANASHELRSPLTVISGYLETLAGDPDLDPVVAQPIREMRRQAERMTAIVRDLLDLSRLESSDREVEGVPVDVPGLCTLLRKDLLARPGRPAEVRLILDSDAWLLGDESQLHSAFANLIDNAAKYTPATGRIDIRWWTDVEGAYFAVSDTGCGFAPEHIPRLTERFYRVDPGRARDTGGSGLGLAIVKHVLQRHGGELEIESAEGRGSTFTCRFPPKRIVADARRATA